ncbi:SAICAR synthase-like protein [Dichomitus squalens LYAD-421 SS1]|uniref:Kinase n=1 Tax=Dichomitus squalens (strain LYAD-421) TaxID=732165 RepID=R7SKB8_DICSQ|nr:SAICAR synthase-like protein [Dichomitus squalens LYAD-421 SS1]EJF56298.1 SAICAR synthase-like protein [Dichomitus squalens LYAD-421 SS1]
MSASGSSKVIPLDSQVGGHPGVLTSEDGSLLIKPAHPTEVAFYQTVIADPGFAPLRPFVPKFYGTLRLEGKVDDTAPAPEEGSQFKVVEVATEAEKESLVLENLSHSFAKPNILDVKLGTVLYDDEASPEKRARMEKTARETTSLETGVRLTGFQVYDITTGKAVNTPKAYGKSIKPADLPDGIARFFPFGVTYDELANPSSGGASSEAPATGTGLPPDVLLPILESMREDVAEIREALAQVHMRMVGGSLLIIYEADWGRAREGLKWLEEAAEDEDEEDEEDEDEDEDEKRVGPPYLVKLIDFAHTKVVPGIGPDEGVLKGVDTILTLLDGRIQQTKAVIASTEAAPAS